MAVAWSGCVRAGFDVEADGPALDIRPKDGPPKPDSLRPDQTSGDGGVVPGTWVAIAKGTFTMGSPASEPCRKSNEDQHQVTLTHGFEIQATEVTQGQFQSLMGYNPSSFKSCGSNCPVETVTWHEAVAYCNALSHEAGKAPCYTCSGSGSSMTCQDGQAFSGQMIYTCPGYRLPTEAEWEYAYRAGTQTPYHSGANDPSMCTTCSSLDPNADTIGWYRANSAVTYLGCYQVTGCGCLGPHPVGQKAANTWGLFDMAGNVWEWCHDWYQSNLGVSAVTDPWGPLSGSARVDRGCSWYNIAGGLRAAARDSASPTLPDDSVGFRCVVSILP